MNLNLQRLAGAVRGKRGNMTQRQTAGLIDCSVSTVRKMEQGREVPSLQTYLKVVTWLKVPLEFFVDDGD